ncbi:hypothetical protein HAZT_HAZT008279, partial [Hyalella azteca]
MKVPSTPTITAVKVPSPITLSTMKVPSAPTITTVKVPLPLTLTAMKSPLTAPLASPSDEPRVELQARDSVTQLKEGESAELLCRVRANPPAHLYAWYLNGAAVVQDSVTVVRAGRLSLPSVRPHQAGRYTCEATNIIGATTSNALHITVLHKPRCAKGFQSRSERVARGDTVRVTCRVDASPATSLAYTWTRLTDDGRETLLPYM